MTTKYEIELPRMPDGWKPIAFRSPKKGECFLMDDGDVEMAGNDRHSMRIIVEKIKPRRIVLEETGEFRCGKKGEYCEQTNGMIWLNINNHTTNAYKIWREVKEEE